MNQKISDRRAKTVIDIARMDFHNWDFSSANCESLRHGYVFESLKEEITQAVVMEELLSCDTGQKGLINLVTEGLIKFVTENIKGRKETMNAIEKEAEYHICKFVECQISEKINSSFTTAISEVVAGRISGEIEESDASRTIYNKVVKELEPTITDIAVDFSIFIDHQGSMMGKNINIDINIGKSKANIQAERPERNTSTPKRKARRKSS